MKIKNLLLLSLLLFAGYSANAADYEYVGTNNTQVTAITGIGETAYYLLYGNLGALAPDAGTTGGFYAGVTAVGATATDACVWQFIEITDSTFYVYNIAAGQYLAIPTEWSNAALTADVAAAAPILVKESTNMAGNFTLAYFDAEGKEYLYQDWGSSNMGAYPPADNGGSYDLDGESDWTIYRADVKFTQSFPITFTPANGLPAQNSTSSCNCTPWKSPIISTGEAVSSFRITVTQTSPGNGNRFHDFIFFCMSELTVYDGTGTKVELGESNYTTNALETSEGAISYLCDGATTTSSGDNTAFFHTSWGNAAGAIGGEHYVEVSLPTSLSEFSFEIAPRTNTGWGTSPITARNYPSIIGITAGGEPYDPFASYGFELHEQVAPADIAAGKLYVMKSATMETEEFPAYENGRRARLTPTVDCIFSLADAGDGYYIKYYLRDQYVAAPTANGTLALTSNITSAGVFTFNADGTIATADGYNLYILNEGLAAYADTAIVWTVYGAGVDNSTIKATLATAIETSQNVLDVWGTACANYDDGEIAALTTALDDANALYANESSTATEILATIEVLNSAAASVRALEILQLCDSISAILMDEHFANEAGAYPVSQQTILTNAMDDAQIYFDDALYTKASDVETYTAAMKDKITTFWASTIQVTVFPLTISDATVLGTLTEAGTQYAYTSPVLFLEDPISQFRMTVIHSNTGDNGGGYECFALSEFYVYDADGNALELTVDNYRTNAQEATEGPLENICDGNTEVANYFHTQWSSTAATSEHYLEVILPEPMYCFSFGYISRNLRTVPMEVVVATEAYVPYDSLGFLLGEKATLADLNTTDYYVMYGNLNVVSEGADGSGFYNGTSVSGFTANRNNLFQLEDAGDGKYNIHFLLSDKYIAAPTGWDNVGTTYNAAEAGKFVFAESTNLEGAFKIYQQGPLSDTETLAYYVLQDWSGMGAYGFDSFDDDDTNGESDWYIYKSTFTANPDSARLLGVIAHAKDVMPIEGTDPGCYPSIGNFTEAYETAIALRYSGGTDQEYKDAVTALLNVLNGLSEDEIIKPEIGKTYLFVSAYGEYLAQQDEEKAMYMSEGLGIPRWTALYADSVATANFWWTLEEGDSTGVVYIKNYATQTYVGFESTNSTQIPLSETGTRYVIETLGGGQFKLHSLDGVAAGTSDDMAYLHTNGHTNGAGTNGNLVFWSAGINGASAWYLREVDPTLIEITKKDAVEVATTVYYTIGGKMIDAPVKGINIVKTINVDGTTSVKKIFVK